jgi:microcystin-dependent protein
MADPFIGEIRMFGGTFAPLGWAFCDGRLLPIDQNPALFTLIGTTYGGNGTTTFALPDLRGRLPLHFGSGFVQGQIAGTETVTLTAAQNPTHNHTVSAQTNANANTPANGVYGGGVTSIYRAAPSSTMNGAMVRSTGGLPHDNLMPFLVVNFIIALEGIFPSQN